MLMSSEGRQLILAVDPGNVTGVALWDLNDLRATPVAAEIVGAPDVYRAINLLLSEVHDRGDSLEVVAESFVIGSRTMKATRTWDVLNILGYLDSLPYLSGEAVTLQKPAQAKSFATDTKLKRISWWKPTEGGHANDALRHLFTYVCEWYRPTVAPLVKKAYEGDRYTKRSAAVKEDDRG